MFEHRTRNYSGRRVGLFGTGLSPARRGTEVVAPLTGLVGYWTLSESSGNRLPSVGSVELAPTNAPGGDTGPSGMGNSTAFVTASSQSLEAANDASFQEGDFGYTVALWVKLASKAAQMWIAGHEGASQFGWAARWLSSTDRFSWQTSSNGTAAISVSSATFGAPVIGQWHFLVGRYHKAEGQISLSVDAGPRDVGSQSGQHASTGVLRVGGRYNNTLYVDGSLAGLGVWHRLLNASEISYLYNAGAGRPYPFS